MPSKEEIAEILDAELTDEEMALYGKGLPKTLEELQDSVQTTQERE